jgi:hypothetical protein
MIFASSVYNFSLLGAENYRHWNTNLIFLDLRISFNGPKSITWMLKIRFSSIEFPWYHWIEGGWTPVQVWMLWRILKSLPCIHPITRHYIGFIILEEILNGSFTLLYKGKLHSHTFATVYMLHLHLISH